MAAAARSGWATRWIAGEDDDAVMPRIRSAFPHCCGTATSESWTGWIVFLSRTSARPGPRGAWSRCLHVEARPLMAGRSSSWAAQLRSRWDRSRSAEPASDPFVLQRNWFIFGKASLRTLVRCELFIHYCMMTNNLNLNQLLKVKFKIWPTHFEVKLCRWS
jgi:hypothetical protein